MMKHEDFMRRALELARMAGALGEVPVGALAVQNNAIIAESYNQRELLNSCLAHAEMRVIAEASKKLQRWRLSGITIYSTLEPCIMCSGALVHSRIDELVYGARDPKFGAIDSLYSMANDTRLNHRFRSQSGVLEQECAELMKGFFFKLRNKNPKN